MIYFIIGLSIILDGIITNYLPFLPNNLSLLTPLLTITSLIYIYPFFKKKKKKFYLILFITGIVYDLFYTNLLFFHAVIFVLLGLIIKKIYKYFEITSIKIIFYIILIIVSYEFIVGSLLFIFQLVPINISKIIYKIINSLILNIIWGEILYGVLFIYRKKTKRISMN